MAVEQYNQLADYLFKMHQQRIAEKEAADRNELADRQLDQTQIQIDMTKQKYADDAAYQRASGLREDARLKLDEKIRAQTTVDKYISRTAMNSVPLYKGMLDANKDIPGMSLDQMIKSNVMVAEFRDRFDANETYYDRELLDRQAQHYSMEEEKALSLRNVNAQKENVEAMLKKRVGKYTDGFGNLVFKTDYDVTYDPNALNGLVPATKDNTNLNYKYNDQIERYLGKALSELPTMVNDEQAKRFIPLSESERKSLGKEKLSLEKQIQRKEPNWSGQPPSIEEQTAWTEQLDTINARLDDNNEETVLKTFEEAADLAEGKDPWKWSDAQNAVHKTFGTAGKKQIQDVESYGVYSMIMDTKEGGGLIAYANRIKKVNPDLYSKIEKFVERMRRSATSYKSSDEYKDAINNARTEALTDNTKLRTRKLMNELDAQK